MNYQTLSLNIDRRGIAYLHLARPDKHNSMDSTMLNELARAAESLDQNQSVRAVVLSGQGDSFCAGADLGWMRQNLDQGRQERIAQSRRLAELLEQFGRLSKLLIARVNGQAYGGGIGLISVCDIAIGVSSARFSLTEVKLGLAPANISPYVINRIGKRNARRCMLNAHFFKGNEAVTLGLLDKSVAPDELDNAVENEITELLNCAPNAVARTKKLIDRIDALDPEETMVYTSELLAELWEGDEAREGVSAFFEKRKPGWVR